MGNAEHPGADPAFAWLEARRTAPQADEYLLGQLLRRGAVAHDPETQRVNPQAVAIVELRDGVCVAIGNTRHELCIFEVLPSQRLTLAQSEYTRGSPLWLWVGTRS